MLDLLGSTSDDLIAAARATLPQGHGVAARLYRALHREGRFAPEELGLGAPALSAWQAAAPALPVPARVCDEPGELGVTAKAWLRLADGRQVECVRIPMRVRDGAEDHTLCLSTQVGCRMACAFCETGRMGLIRQLTAAEIVGEVVAVRAHLGWRPRNLVFMGMGEPLDNAANLVQALRVLCDPRGLAYSHERITVCTSGHAEGLAQLATLGWKRLNLSISLNAADDATRDRLMPVNRRTPLAELQRLLAAWPQRRNFCLGVNWCLMPGINDGADSPRRIADFCRPLGRVLVNVIPYNPGSEALTRPPSEDEVVAFIRRLRAEGLAVRRRVTKGRSIMAACGQLGEARLPPRRI